MSAVADVIIGVVELAEAEGRKLRTSAKGLVLAIVLIVVAGFLLLGGLGWLVAAGFLLLRDWLGATPAAFIMGLVSLLVAGGAIWYAMRRR